jgi:nicotinamidase-related amidase
MKILVVVDMQNDFIDGALGTAEAVAIVPSVIEKIKSYEKNGDIVIYTKDTHTEEYLKTSEGINLPVEHCIKGTFGHDIPAEILRSHELIFEKPTFGSLALAEYLHTLDFDEVELIGLCTDICVISNALLIKANFPEKTVAVDSSCCAGVTPDTHNAALTTMKMCQIKVK